MLTTQQCKQILSSIGLKLGISPSLIATNLLSEDDKQDMLNGDLPRDSLETHVKCWIEAGTPKYTL